MFAGIGIMAAATARGIMIAVGTIGKSKPE
jgi:hypothetical protein